MKIALCLSGGLRNFKDTYYSFKNFLLDRYDVDVFFYGLENKEGVDKNTIDLINLYNPKKFKINTNSFYETLKSELFNIDQKKEANTYYSFFNVMKCVELKSEYEIENKFKYDIVIRSRTDLFWFREINKDEIDLAKNNILTPEEWSFKGVNNFGRFDGFAIGTSDLINEYSKLFERIEEYNYKIKPNLHGESLIGYHLMINNIPNIENNRVGVFEYPSRSIEKFIYPYKFIKYFDDLTEDDFDKYITKNRKDF
jgi:hypothetical protein